MFGYGCTLYEMNERRTPFGIRASHLVVCLPALLLAIHPQLRYGFFFYITKVQKRVSERFRFLDDARCICSPLPALFPASQILLIKLYSVVRTPYEVRITDYGSRPTEIKRRTLFWKDAKRQSPSPDLHRLSQAERTHPLPLPTAQN